MKSSLNPLIKMSQLGMILQESVAAGGGGGQESRTILAFLRQQMDGVDHDGRRSSTRLSFKERLGLKGLGCCGTTWAFRAPTTVSVRDDHDDEGEEDIVVVMNLDHRADPPEREPDPDCLSPITAATRGMNLAAALAAERQFRTEASSYNGVGPTNSRVGSPRGGLISAPGTPMRVSLMRLIEETDGRDVEMEVETEKEKEKEKESSSCCGVGGGSDTVCCVCMVRKKGAAFIPCGHTFCRVCSREVWLNRGSCPLCNRSILEILDIF